MSRSTSRTPSWLIVLYLDITSWSASRKAAFVNSYHVLGLALIWTHAWLTISRMPELVSWERVAPLLAPMLTTVVLIAILCFAIHRAGMEGRWVPYATVVPTAALYAWLFSLYGTLSTPLVILYPMLVIITMLIYGKRVGWFAFVSAIALGLPVVLWEIYSAPEYAPALVDRSIDGQRNGYWFAYIYVSMQVAFFIVLALVHLAISARERREFHLAEAHQRLAGANDRLNAANDLIRRYVPGQLAEKILRGDYRQHSRPERRRVTLFFSDVEGFTAASDQLEPEDLAELLNEYLSEMVSIADTFGATVDQFVGDGLMIFFGAPETTDDRDHALRAVRMALAMQRRMVALRDRWFQEGIEKPFRIRVGIHTGMASVGDFGSAGRMTYSAIGKETNLTARIQGRCEPGKILISHSTWALVRDEIPCTDRGEIELKGVHHPIRVYEVAGEFPKS